MSGFGKQHDAIWDDSELINTWNEALAEYKKYHSMAARGEMVNVEDLPEPKPDQNNAESDEMDETAEGADQYEPMGADAQHNADAGTSEQQQYQASMGAQLGTMLPANIKDEQLKNLMMSWYYAGYYTGLYEGTNQARQNGADKKDAS